MWGQDGILRAGWQPASVCNGAGGFPNPPQVANLPHEFGVHKK